MTKLRVETRMVCKLTDCHSDLSTYSEENTILPITSSRNNIAIVNFFFQNGHIWGGMLPV